MNQSAILFGLVIALNATLAHGLDNPSSQRGCFYTHLKDAMNVNRSRTDAYSKASDGKSWRASLSVRGIEAIMLPIAIYWDNESKPFQEQGIGLFCDEFESMSKIPPLVPQLDSKPRPFAEVPEVNTAQMKERLQGALENEGLDGIAKAVDREIEGLAADPSYYCMIRHTLESIRRAAKVGPIHVRQAEALKLDAKRVKTMTVNFEEQQITYLGIAHIIDRWAAPAQAEGVPVICHDIPKIPPLPEGLAEEQK